ncbi:L-ascorbate metabolism protein UlaG, beta-lactamase superfamily [Aeromonas sp. RU39B]|nr:L-ascorbate metabolism protein UlaG, beta-lactamase superfamily [Aeromonas sp. RU39B]
MFATEWNDVSAEQPGAINAQSPLKDSDGRYRNRQPRRSLSLGKRLSLLWEVLFNKPASTVPASPIPVVPVSRSELLEAPDHSVYRLGHSSLLLKLDGELYLTDPVFVKRASPFSWLGPKRFHAPPIGLTSLPPIRAVILSHDHYDHLDKQSVLYLARTGTRFYAPLGVGDRLMAWGIAPEQVVQLSWWQSSQCGALRLTATPAQHFSGRGLRDGNQTLWCSWVIESSAQRLFFSGDGGYFDGFAAIGQQFGSFDMAFMETGAYDPRWSSVHMHPEQTLQATRDLNARWLLPIHNGTFDLAMHSWFDPFEQICALAHAARVPVCTPKMGERISLLTPSRGDPWWRPLMATSPAQERCQSAG